MTTTSTRFQPLANCSFTASQLTEVNNQIKWETAGTFTNLYVRVVSTGSATRSVHTRKAAVDGNLTVAMTTTQIGVFEDTTHNDVVTAADVWAYSFLSGSSVSTVYGPVAVTFAATTNTATRLAVAKVGVTAAGSGDNFNTLAGTFNRTATTEANSKTRMRKAGTFTNLCIHLTADVMSTGTNKVLGRLNGVAGVVTLTIGASATGFLEDTTHTDTVAAGDDYNTDMSFTSASNSTIQSIAIDYTSTSSDGLQVCGNAALATPIQGITYFFPLSSDLSLNSGTEADAKCLSKDTYTCSQLTINAITNGVAATSQFRSRVSGFNGGQTATITASTAGVYSDTINTDVLLTTDDVNYQLACGASGTSMTVSFMDMATATTTIKTVNMPTETVTVSETQLRKPIPQTVIYVPM